MPKKKVLIVDDEKDISKNLKEIIEMEGCESFTALTTPEAWDIFQREKPDVCVIDIHMAYSPYNGIELLRKIREVNKKVKCIILTCVDAGERGEEAKKIGVQGYYEKPLGDKFDEFVGKVIE